MVEGISLTTGRRTGPCAVLAGIFLAPRLACVNADAAVDLLRLPVLRALLAAAAAFFEVAMSVPASRNTESFVEFTLTGLHAMDHEVFLGLVKHDHFDQSPLWCEPKYPGPRWIVVDHVVRNVYVLQGVSYVVLGVPALEGRVVDLQWSHLINVTRNSLVPQRKGLLGPSS
jgi:hypothetical protein